MMGQTPFAGIAVNANATIQALLAATVAGAKLTVPFTGSVATELTGTAGSGDNSVKPDKANSRMLVQSHSGKTTYKATLSATLKSSAAANVTLDFRKNGVSITPLQPFTVALAVSSVPQKINHEVVFDILPSDNPGTIAPSGDPPATSFAGAAAQPKNMVPIEVYVITSADTNFLIPEGLFKIERVG